MPSQFVGLSERRGKAEDVCEPVGNHAGFSGNSLRERPIGSRSSRCAEEPLFAAPAALVRADQGAIEEGMPSLMPLLLGSLQ